MEEQKEKKSEKTEVELLKEEIEKLKSENKEWEQAYKIKLADFDNYKKRKDREFEEIKKYACQDLVLAQLNEIDSLEKAISATVEHETTKSLLDGINMVIKNMMNKLKDMGVE